MFFKREMRLQTSGAPAPNDRYSKMNSSITFNTANDAPSDFGSFDSEPERAYAPARKKQSGNGFDFARKLKKNKKAAIIIASAIAVAILITVGVIITACSGILGSGDVKYQNNAYLTYVNQDKHYVIANGEVLDHEFKGVVELIPSDDNSFAYILDYGDDGIYLYVLEGKELTAVSESAVEEFITAAKLKPGIIFTEVGSNGAKYMYYSPKAGIQEITKEKKNPADFIISDDAETVVYTIENDEGARIPQVYENGVYDKLKNSSCTPVAISGNGNYVYVKRNVDGVDKLYVIDRTKDGETSAISNSDNFTSILEMNVKGDEIIFCTTKTPDDLSDALDGELIEARSYIYRHKQKEDKVLLLGAGYINTAKDASPEIARYKTFAGKYFETQPVSINGKKNTFRLSDKFEIENIKDKKGKFSPDGKFFYYLNDDSDLYRIDLKDEARSSSLVYEDVKDFAITEKSNVYLMDSDYYLVFYKASTNSKPRISSYANEMSMYRCANKLYFAENESEVIYVTEEGSEKDIAKFGTAELAAVPYFSSQVTKKGYAAIYNESTNSYTIYYTSNGNRFKAIRAVSGCDEITYGVDFPEPIEW